VYGDFASALIRQSSAHTHSAVTVDTRYISGEKEMATKAKQSKRPRKESPMQQSSSSSNCRKSTTRKAS
jgi:hypothetical protein